MSSIINFYSTANSLYRNRIKCGTLCQKLLKKFNSLPLAFCGKPENFSCEHFAYNFRSSNGTVRFYSYRTMPMYEEEQKIFGRRERGTKNDVFLNIEIRAFNIEWLGKHWRVHTICAVYEKNAVYRIKKKKKVPTRWSKNFSVLFVAGRRLFSAISARLVEWADDGWGRGGTRITCKLYVVSKYRMYYKVKCVLFSLEYEFFIRRVHARFYARKMRILTRSNRLQKVLADDWREYRIS